MILIQFALSLATDAAVAVPIAVAAPNIASTAVVNVAVAAVTASITITFAAVAEIFEAREK
jgi:hypothetical protein